MNYGGVLFVSSPHMTEPCVDFSRSRSPSRALRRWKTKGIRGHGVFERPSLKVFRDMANNVMFCHPVVYHQIVAKLQQAHEGE